MEGLEGPFPRRWVGCPGVPPAPEAGYLPSPARASTTEHGCLVWAKRPFFQGCRGVSTAASGVSVRSRNPEAAPAVCVGLAACPGHGLGAVGCFNFLFFFPSLGVTTHNDAENACEEMPFPWLLRGGSGAGALLRVPVLSAGSRSPDPRSPQAGWDGVRGVGPRSAASPLPGTADPPALTPLAGTLTPLRASPCTPGSHPTPEQRPRTERGRAAGEAGIPPPQQRASETPALSEGQRRRHGRANPAHAMAVRGSRRMGFAGCLSPCWDVLFLIHRF